MLYVIQTTSSSQDSGRAAGQNRSVRVAGITTTNEAPYNMAEVTAALGLSTLTTNRPATLSTRECPIPPRSSGLRPPI